MSDQETLIITYLKDHSSRLSRIETRVAKVEDGFGKMRTHVGELRAKNKLKTTMIGAAGVLGAAVTNLLHKVLG